MVPPIDVIDDQTMAYGPVPNQPNILAPIEKLSIHDQMIPHGDAEWNLSGVDTPELMVLVTVLKDRGGSCDCFVLKTELERLISAMQPHAA